MGEDKQEVPRCETEKHGFFSSHARRDSFSEIL